MRWIKTQHAGHCGSKWALTEKWIVFGTVVFDRTCAGKPSYYAIALVEPAGTPLSKQPWARKRSAKSARQWVENTITAYAGDMLGTE